MATVDYNKYQKLILKYSYNGSVWTPVLPTQIRKGEVIEANSYDCGYIDPITRWVAVDGEYFCIDYSKYVKLRQQVSNDDGATWEWVVPYNEQAGDLLEANSYDCDYGVTWEPVPNEYICRPAFFETNYCNVQCPDAIEYPETRTVYSSHTIPELVDGYQSTGFLAKGGIYAPHLGVMLRSDGYLFTWDIKTGSVLYNNFLSNLSAWTSILRGKTELNNWNTTNSYKNVNHGLIGDYIYSSISQYKSTYRYYHNVIKINIKTGVLTVLVDTGETTSPVWSTSNMSEIGGIKPFQAVNTLITDTGIYAVYQQNNATNQYGYLKMDLYCGNPTWTVLGDNLKISSDGNYLGFFTHNDQFIGKYYIFKDLVERYSDTPKKTYGEIWVVDMLGDRIAKKFGLWICDIDAITSSCGNGYTYHKQNIDLYIGSAYTYYLAHQIFVDTPVLETSNTQYRFWTIGDYNTKIYKAGGSINQFSPIYQTDWTDGTVINIYKY